MSRMRIVLASASPRRRELLRQIGWDFEVCVSEIEEKITKTHPAEVVEELSAQKAEEVWHRLTEEAKQERQENSGRPEAGKKPDASESDNPKAPEGTLLVIGADTIVACEGKILGKPKSRKEAVSMLESLEGRSHQVYTGVTLLLGRDACAVRKISFHEETRVNFYPMSRQEIESYADSGEPFDKAGAYGIQGLCARYIQGIEGDYNNVVGLPVGRLYQEVRKLMRKKAVIFDLDGTLSDSIASIKYCADRAVAPFGYGPYSTEQYKQFVGDGAANLIRRCLAAGGDEEQVHFQEAYAAYRELFKRDCMYQVKPYAGIPELLAALKEQGIRIAVLSNKPHSETVRVIRDLFGDGCFDAIQGQEPGLAIKPSPEGAFRILKAWGLSADEILYLGDTCTDMRTGKALGAFTVGALWGFRDRKELEDNRADAIIAHPLELLSYL